MVELLGERIASLRGRLGWSQAELARRLNISASAVGMYEQGRREPSMDMLLALSRTLGVTTDFLLTGRSVCQRDWRALAAIASKPENFLPETITSDYFSKDELLVLLTASVCGRQED